MKLLRNCIKVKKFVIVKRQCKKRLSICLGAFQGKIEGMHKSKEIRTEGMHKSREIPLEQMEPLLSGSGKSFMVSLT